MHAARPLKIVIASAGRRAHYIEWFRSALSSQGISGEIIAMEYRTTSPTFGLANRNMVAPAYNSPDYSDFIRDWVRAERPDLFLSLNDYENQIMSDGLADELRELGCKVAALSPFAQSVVLDKYRMAAVLAEHGLATPITHLGSHATLVKGERPQGRFVVKHRFGSGSRGLQVASGCDLEEAVTESARTAIGKHGTLDGGKVDNVVVQELLPGTEYGIDGMFSLDGSGSLLGVLARRKDVMRDGDTDIATTVSADRFVPAMSGLGDLLKPIGPIDVDFRETAEGRPDIIDINPRLGGGYPYCHRAGADLPAAIVRTLAGLEDEPSLLTYRFGVTTARREDFTVVHEDVDMPVGSR
ncbi:ATP-grasp domain-containing protein [Brevibacterium antiquum]|uniref:ATP-grasp domain-containing protein n=1 Tax=Brevibacterium antiquum TaxID=234835 RepID=UPI0018DF04E2|nr:ATP-grasp domain-containing protein [Brevibacterium antiquum]